MWASSLESSAHISVSPFACENIWRDIQLFFQMRCISCLSQPMIPVLRKTCLGRTLEEYQLPLTHEQQVSPLEFRVHLLYQWSKQTNLAKKVLLHLSHRFLCVEKWLHTAGEAKWLVRDKIRLRTVWTMLERHSELKGHFTLLEWSCTCLWVREERGRHQEMSR